MSEFRRDRKSNGGGVIIVTKDFFDVTDHSLQTTSQNEIELVWGSTTLKDHSKEVVDSYYRPPNKGVSPILKLESQLSEIMYKCINNSKKILSLWVVTLV